MKPSRGALRPVIVDPTSHHYLAPCTSGAPAHGGTCCPVVGKGKTMADRSVARAQ